MRLTTSVYGMITYYIIFTDEQIHSIASPTCQIHDNWFDNGQGTCTAQVTKCEGDEDKDSNQSNVQYCLHVTTIYGDGIRNTSIIVTQLPYNISYSMCTHLYNCHRLLTVSKYYYRSLMQLPGNCIIGDGDSSAVSCNGVDSCCICLSIRCVSLETENEK